jgi:O-succinylbenzoic acid--CoA ligase
VTGDWLAEAARLYRDRPFLVQGDWRWTFAEWHERVDRVAGRLAAVGAGPNTRVAVLVGGGYQAAELVFAVRRLGAVLVPLNPRLAAPEIAYQVADANPHVAVVAESLTSRWPAGAPSLVVPEVTPPADPLLADPWRAESAADPSDIQSIIYTSGTTGRPKGALVTVRQQWWNAFASMLRIGHQAGDAWLCCLPLFHVGGQAILFRAVMGGAAVVLEPRFDAERAARILADGTVTLASLVPTMLRRVLSTYVGPFSPRLRAVLIGGSAAPPALLDEARGRGMPVLATYGMTETASQMATEEPDRADGRRALPLYGYELRIDHPGSDGAGEICVRGPGVSPGYWRRPDTTAERFEEGGWFRTGDIGRLHPDGRIEVLDRRDDLIVSGGENIYAAEVEAALAALPEVEAAAVVGVPHPEWGMVPAAAVVPRAGAAVDPAELERRLASTLARYKIPKTWSVVDALPMTANGKVRRAEVREWFRNRGPKGA